MSRDPATGKPTLSHKTKWFDGAEYSRANQVEGHADGLKIIASSDASTAYVFTSAPGGTLVLSSSSPFTSATVLAQLSVNGEGTNCWIDTKSSPPYAYITVANVPQFTNAGAIVRLQLATNIQ